MSCAMLWARLQARVETRKQMVLPIIIVLRPNMSARRPQKGYLASSVIIFGGVNTESTVVAVLPSSCKDARVSA